MICGGPRLSLTGCNYQPQSNHVQRQHNIKQGVCSRWRIFEFLPDKYSPKCRDHRGSLAKSIGYRRPGLSRSDDTEGHANAPDYSTGNAREMISERAGEVLPVRDGCPDKGP